jgi:hypothetical protein
MIVFDLCCEKGHCFEGWFSDAVECDRELSEGVVACPVCSNAGVKRVPSTFGIKGAPRGEGASGLPNPLQVLQRFSEFVKSSFDDVGSGFAAEALKIHYGVSEARNIRGTSTEAEEKMLRDEGVKFSKVPLLAPKDTDA